MIYLLKIIFGIKILVLFNLPFFYPQGITHSTTQTSFENKIIVGEEYTYIVKYAFLNLGEVKTKVFAKENLDGKTFPRIYILESV